MIVGIGMDLVEVARLRSFHQRWGQPGLDRLFAPGEIRYCLAAADPAPSLAARFAAKEAFFKALGTGWGVGGDWREVQVQRDPGAAPRLRVAGRAARSLSAHPGASVHLTLTHARSTAGAVVVIER
jgi:holo-[acyl-carrier protein] synthase